MDRRHLPKRRECANTSTATSHHYSSLLRQLGQRHSLFLTTVSPAQSPVIFYTYASVGRGQVVEANLDFNCAANEIRNDLLAIVSRSPKPGRRERPKPESVDI
jgi:hypothetical protein